MGIRAPAACQDCGKVLARGMRVLLAVYDDSGEELVHFRCWYCCHVCMGQDLFDRDAPQSGEGVCASNSCMAD